MADYNKVCWYCKSKDLEDMGTHVKCRECGATYNPVPRLGLDPLDPNCFVVRNISGDTLYHARKPSNRAKREAALARANK